MIKAVFLVYRRPDLSPEEFRRYWVDVHGPLAASIPGLRKYVINFPLPGAWTAPYDGISELWFDSAEAYEAGLASPEGRASDADGVNFQDAAREELVLVEEVSVA
jgi:uncharacterized protein (TIGR02118 family)